MIYSPPYREEKETDEKRWRTSVSLVKKVEKSEKKKVRKER